MRKLISSFGFSLFVSGVFVLGWAIGQPEEEYMAIRTAVVDGMYIMCDFNKGQCNALTIEDVQEQLLIAEIYRKL